MLIEGELRRWISSARLIVLETVWIFSSTAYCDFVPVGEKWGSSVFGTGATVTWSLRPTEP